jgi:hypothetical protein
MAVAHRALLDMLAQEALLNQLPAQVDNILPFLQTVIQQACLYLECQLVLFHHHAQREIFWMPLDAFLVQMEQRARAQLETLCLAPTLIRVLVLLLALLDLTLTMAFAINVWMIISSVQVELLHLLLFLMDTL